MSESSKFGVALIQLSPAEEKNAGIANAVKLIKEAVLKYQPKLIALPECFNSPYGNEHLQLNAEYIPSGQTSVALSNLAKELDIYIVGGSYPEIDENHANILYNSIAVFSRTGELVAKHRKLHLDDKNIEVDFVHRESDNLSAGHSLNTFEVDGYKIGLGICYDMIFSEVGGIYQQLGCHMVIYPSAFPICTGNVWNLKITSRASDNKYFTAAISPARNYSAEYISYGYSCFANPEGKIVKQAGLDEEILFYEIDFNEVEKNRTEKHRRTDL